jgi:hypothetical protein
MLLANGGVFWLSMESAAAVTNYLSLLGIIACIFGLFRLRVTVYWILLGSGFILVACNLSFIGVNYLIIAMIPELQDTPTPTRSPAYLILFFALPWACLAGYIAGVFLLVRAHSRAHIVAGVSGAS